MLGRICLDFNLNIKSFIAGNFWPLFRKYNYLHCIFVEVENNQIFGANDQSYRHHIVTDSKINARNKVGKSGFCTILRTTGIENGKKYLPLCVVLCTIDESIKGAASLRRYGITFDGNIDKKYKTPPHFYLRFSTKGIFSKAQYSVLPRIKWTGQL